MFNIERIIGWLMSVVLLGAVAWSVTGFVSDPGEPRRPPAATKSMAPEEMAFATVPKRVERDPASPDVVAGPFTLGDDASLDGLWVACEAGDGVACDRLFELSPVGSDYERFGLTCGDRPLVLDCAAELGET